MSTPDFEALLEGLARAAFFLGPNDPLGSDRMASINGAKAKLRAYVQSLTPVWTDTVPTEPGWYWYRDKEEGDAHPVNVWRGSSGALFVQTMHQISFACFQWCKIPEPQEP